MSLIVNFQYKSDGSLDSMTQDFSKDENEHRGNWTGRLDFLLACLGLAVGERFANVHVLFAFVPCVWSSGSFCCSEHSGKSIVSCLLALRNGQEWIYAITLGIILKVSHIELCFFNRSRQRLEVSVPLLQKWWRWDILTLLWLWSENKGILLQCHCFGRGFRLVVTNSPPPHYFCPPTDFCWLCPCDYCQYQPELKAWYSATWEPANFTSSLYLFFSCVFHPVLHHAVLCWNAHLLSGVKYWTIHQQWTVDMLGNGSHFQGWENVIIGCDSAKHPTVMSLLGLGTRFLRARIGTGMIIVSALVACYININTRQLCHFLVLEHVVFHVQELAREWSLSPL